MQCSECGNPFTPLGPRNLTCGPECSRARHKRTAPERARRRIARDPERHRRLSRERMRKARERNPEKFRRRWREWYAKKMLAVRSAQWERVFAAFEATLQETR